MTIEKAEQYKKKDIEEKEREKEVIEHQCCDIFILDDEIAIQVITSKIFDKLNLKMQQIIDGLEFNSILDKLLICDTCRTKKIVVLVD